MEHFYLIITDDFLNSEDGVIKYLQSLLLSQKQLYTVTSQSLLPHFLKCNSVNISSICNNSIEKNSIWTQIDLDLCLNHSFFQDFRATQLKAPENSGKQIQILCSRIHSLADQLPKLGSFKLDVLINYEVLKNLSISKDGDLASALYRLYLWHGAHATIIVPHEYDHCLLKEWCNIMDAEILQTSPAPVSSPVLWRGSIMLSNTEEQSISYPGFQLGLNLQELETCNNHTIDQSDLNEPIILSTSLNVVEEYSFSSIPPYLFLPLCFILYLSEPNYFNKTSREFYNYICSQKGVALIVRMGYSLSSEKLKPDRTLSTKKWQRMLSGGNIKLPDDVLPTSEHFLTFALTRCPRSGHIIARPMRDPSRIRPDVYFKAFDSIHWKPEQCNSNATDHNTGIELPFVDESFVSELASKVTFPSTCKKNEDCDGNLINHTVNIKSALETILKEKERISLRLSNTVRVTSEEIDPANWPERVHLLQKQLQEDQKKKFLANAQLNFSPQVPKNQILFNCEDVDKYFLPSGLAKDSTGAEPLSVVSGRQRQERTDHDTVIRSKWPDVLHCVYDDLYYNCDPRAEEKENLGVEMVRFYVQHETATTCNPQQLHPRAPLQVRPRPLRHPDRWRSPRKQRSADGRGGDMSRSLHPRGSQSLPKPSHPNPRHPATENHVMNLSQRMRKVSRTPSLPVRSSPRKKMPVAYAMPSRCSPRKKMPVSYTESLRSSPRKKMTVSYAESSRSNPGCAKRSNNNKTGERSQHNEDKLKGLQELAVKKLRVAVASALEKNGINVGNALFRRCFKRLFAVCQAFARDIPKKKGSTSEHLQKIADAHVKQVIDFERTQGES